MEDSGLIYSGAEITDQEILPDLPEEYRYFLQQMNGCVLFDGGLHIRGAVQSPDWHSLRNVWHGDLALSKLFPEVKDSDVPFAQDCLGDQFLLRSGLVHRLEAERGAVESLEMGFEAFLNRAHENPVEFLSLEPLLQFLSEGGDLKPGQLLNAYPPFLMQEAADGVSLKAVSMFEQIGFLADLATQIRELAEGARVKINLINVNE